MSFDLVGAEDEIGFDSADFGTILQTAGPLVTGVANMAEKQKADAKSAASDQEALNAAKAADAAAANAMATADVSAQLKSASADVDKIAADSAVKNMTRAGAKLSADSIEKRCAAAQKGYDAAVASAQKAARDPKTAKNLWEPAYVKAWQNIVNRASSAQIVASDDDSPKGKGKALTKADKGGGSWFTRKVVGPIPGCGVVAGGVGLLGVAGLIARKILL